MKKILFYFFVLFAISNSSFANQQVGGFGAPIYFTGYDQNQINQIKQVAGINHIQITYPPQLYSLARRIASQLQPYPIQIKMINLHNTALTQYRTDAVIVVIYFNG